MICNASIVLTLKLMHIIELIIARVLVELPVFKNSLAGIIGSDRILLI